MVSGKLQLFFVIALCTACAPESPEPIVLIDAEERSFATERQHQYSLSVAKGDFILVRARQTGADVEIRMYGPGEEHPIIADAPVPIRRFGDEIVWYTSTASGAARIEIVAKDISAPSANYQLTVERHRARSTNKTQRKLLVALSNIATVASTAGGDPGVVIEQSSSLARQSVDAEYSQLVALLLLRRAALTYDQLWEWQRAAGMAAEAADYFRSLGNESGQLAALSLKAAALIESANTGVTGAREATLRDAISVLMECGLRHAALGEEYESAHDENNIGLALVYLGETDPAIARFRSAASRFEKLGSSASQAMALQNIAWVYHERGQYRLARTEYAAPLALLANLNDAKARRAVLNNSALAHSIVGDTEQAVALYQLAIDLQSASADSTDLANSLHGLGEAYLRAGRNTRALEYFTEALPYREQAHDGRALVSTLVAIGNMHRVSGDLTRAIEFHRRAAGLKLGLVDQAKARYALARDFEKQGRHAEAMTELNAILGPLPKRGNEAHGLLEQALPRDVEVRAQALTARARLRAIQGKYEDAIADLREAERVNRENGAVVSGADTMLEHARVQRARGEFDLARRTIEQAAGAAESVRLKAVNPDLRASILASRAAIFEEFVDLLMSRAEQDEAAGNLTAASAWRLRALTARERWHARSQLDRMEAGIRGTLPDLSSPIESEIDRLYQDLAGAKYRLDELRDKSKPDTAMMQQVSKGISLLRRKIDELESIAAQAHREVANAQPLSTEDLRALMNRLRPDTVIAVYSLGNTRSWMWLLSNRGLISKRLPPRSEYRSASNDFRSCLSRLDSQRTIVPDCATHAERMGRLMLPLELLAGDFSRLLFAAEGPMVSIPVAAMIVPGSTPAALAVERWSTAQLPSLTVLFRRAPAGRAPLMSRIGVVVDHLAANVRPSTAPRPTFTGLLTALYGEHAVIALPPAQGAAWSDSRRQWRDYDVLHFGTHAYADFEDPHLSALEVPIAEPNGRISTGKLFLRDIYRTPMTARLVVLAACETGVGQLLPGEGSLSLAHGFMSAGAQGVVGSLWRISDAASEELIGEFYRNYSRIPDHTAALAAAQRRMLSSSRWNHPFFWAGLVSYE